MNDEYMNAWKVRHAAAMRAPNATERPFVQLVTLAGELAEQYATDYVLREAVADLVRAGMTLLNAELGRLDGGTLDGYLRAVAAQINFDIDLDEFE
jgi:hypothetical protein